MFNVLQEKDGKQDGTSVLYHIAEQMASNSEVKIELVSGLIRQAGIEVRDINEDATEENESALYAKKELPKPRQPAEMNLPRPLALEIPRHI